LSGSLFYRDSFPEVLAGNMIFIPKEIVISQKVIALLTVITCSSEVAIEKHCRYFQAACRSEL
jgi:hypothetical protein